MQQQGIRSVMPQGAQMPQGQMPGQAPMQGQPQMPGMMPSQSGPKPGLTAFVPALTAGYDTAELTKMLFDPRSPVPANRVLAAIIEQQKNFATKKAVANELAMRQNAAQQGTIADEVVAQARRQSQPQAAPVQAAHGGEMHSYAGGGAVAFENGGRVQHFADGTKEYGVQSNPEIERILKKSPMMRTPEENEKLRAAGVDLVKRQPAPEGSGVSAFNKALESPFLRSVFSGGAYTLSPEELAARSDTGALTEKLFRGFGGQQYVEPPIASSGPAGTRQGKSGIADLDIGPSIAPAPRPPGVTRPGTGLPRPQNRPQAAPATPLQQLGSAVEQTGTPAPDRLAEIEADERARVEGLQKLLASQAQVDPRIVAARREAAELAQRGIGEREKRAAGALEAAGMPLSQSLFDNQEALFRMLGAMKGGKRIGDAFSSIGQEAGAIRGEQRRALELAQRENRAEQNALDQLRQAQADLKLAQTTGDVQGERNAALKVEEAKANLGLTRLNIQKERATEADRKAQRAIEEKRIATTVSEGALDRASRERLAKAAQTGDSRRVFDTLMDNARAEFEKWEKSPEGASSALKPGVREAKRSEFLEKQVALAKAAGVQGLDPLLAAVKAQSGTGAAPTGQRVVDFASIK